MKKVILNQISKAVAGGSNYFYLPLHLVKDKDNYYETTADLSKLFEVDSNNVPVIKEICVYDDDTTENVYLSFVEFNKSYTYYAYAGNNKTYILNHDGKNVTYNGISVVNSNPKDGGK